MTRRLNLRFTAGILVVVLVLGVGVHLLHGYQVRRNAEMFLREAERATEEKNLQDAVQQYRRYLQLVPDDAKAVADLGLLLADISKKQPGALRSAYETLERALRADPSREDLRRRLVPIAVDIGRYTDAREHLVTYLLCTSPKDPELLFLLAICQEQLGEYAASAKLFQEVITLDPTKLVAYTRLADLLRRRLQKPKEADEVMEKVVTANANSCDAHVRLGRHLRETRSRDDTARLTRASTEAAAALKLAPDNVDALYLAAQCAVDRTEYSQAQAYAAQVVKQHPEFVPIYSLLADVAVRTGRRSEAIARLQDGIKAVPKALDLSWLLANLLLDDGKVSEAKEIAGRLKEAKYTEALTAYVNARADYVQGAWLSASRSFERIRPDLVASPDLTKHVDFWLGGCYRQLGHADQQLTAYRRAVDVDPLWIPARAGVAAALLSMRQIDEALEEYREIARLSGNPTVGAVDLAQLEILRNLWSNRTERNWSEAERLLGIAEKNVPDNVRIPVLRAEVLVAKNHPEQAEKLLQEARARKPHEITFYLALASLAQRDRNWDRAEKGLDDAQKECGDRVPLRLARAQYLVQRFGKDSAQRLRKLAEGIDRFSKEERTELWRGLAAASLQAGDYKQTRRLCQQVSEAEPHNLQIRLLLFDLALRANDDSGLDTILKQIHEIEGEGPYWNYGSALHLSLQAKKDKSVLSKAQEYLARCRTMRPGWSRVPFLSAEFSLQQGNEDLATDQYLQAIDLGERSPRAIRRVLQLLYERQRYLEANRVIRLLQEHQSPFSSELSRLASEVSLRLDDFDRALELAQQAAKGSKDYRDHVWLGQVLSVAGQRVQKQPQGTEAAQRWAEAEKEFRLAVELAGNATDAWVALIQFFVRTGQKPKAEQAIVQAQSKIPAKHAPLALAQCYEAMYSRDLAEKKHLEPAEKTHLELAEKKYLEAIAASPTDVRIVRQLTEFYLRTGQIREAETQLKKITNGQIKAEEADLVWARRALAMILAGHRTYETLKDGLALVEENLSAPHPAVYDMRVKALLLSAHPKREEREKAAEILEKVLQEPRVATAEDRFVLAKLYLSQGPTKWAQAARQFRTLLGSAPNDTMYLGTYVAALLGHKEIDLAERYTNQLEKLAPNQMATVTLRARVLYESGEFPKAMELLKSYCDKPESKGEDRPTRVALIAATLEDLGRRLTKPDQQATSKQFTEEAEKLYRQYVQQRPEQKLVLAGFLARQKRMDEALTLAEEAWPTSSPELIANAMLSLFGGGASGTAQDARAEKILLAAIDKHNRPVSFLTLLADHFSVQGRYEEAEAVYREILRGDPKNTLALNNLAVLLALERKNLEESEELVERAIEYTGPSANSLDSRALVYLARGEPAKALTDIEAVLADSRVAMACFRKAQILVELGRRDEARQSLQEAQKLGLKAGLLHPLERPGYEKLCKAIL